MTSDLKLSLEVLLMVWLTAIAYSLGFCVRNVWKHFSAHSLHSGETVWKKRKKIYYPSGFIHFFSATFLSKHVDYSNAELRFCTILLVCFCHSVFPFVFVFFLLYSFIWGSFFGPSYSCLPVPPSTRLLVDNEITAVIFGRETASLCLGLQSDIRSSAALTLFTPRTNHSTVFLSLNIQRNLSFTYLHLAAGFLLDVFSHQRPW